MSAKDSKWNPEQRKKFSEQCKLRGCNDLYWTQERREEAKKISKEINKNYWTVEKRLEQSKRMHGIVKENPDSYSKSNVSGRVKMYDTFDSTGNTKVKGTWELKVADWLNKNNIKWTNSITPIEYIFENKNHLYFPDFFLIDFNVFLEVKGFETEKDNAKWLHTDKKLFIIRKNEIHSLEDSMNKILSEIGTIVGI